MFIPVVFLMIAIPVSIATGGLGAPAMAWAWFAIAKRMKEREEEDVKDYRPIYEADIRSEKARRSETPEQRALRVCSDIRRLRQSALQKHDYRIYKMYALDEERYFRNNRFAETIDPHSVPKLVAEYRNPGSKGRTKLFDEALIEAVAKKNLSTVLILIDIDEELGKKNIWQD